MSEENTLQALEALDQRVEGLVNIISDLRHERDVLRLEVEESNTAREELDTQLNSLNGNKEEVKSRIESIIDKINKVQSE